MIDTAQLTRTFVSESNDLLAEMEDILLEAERSGAGCERVNALFRTAHTIKGSAGLLGLDHVVAFTHVAESVLERVREGALALDRPLVGLLLRCNDHIGSLIAGVAAGGSQPDDAMRAGAEPLLAELGGYLGAATGPDPAGPHAGYGQAAPAPGGTDGAGSAAHWHLSLRFGEDVLRSGMDPLSFIAYLGTLGRVGPVITLEHALPAPEAMDPEACHLGFELALHSEASRADIEGAFEFVRDQCKLLLVAPHTPLAELAAMAQAHGEPALGDALLACGTLAPQQLAALAQPAAEAGAAAPAALPRQEAAPASGPERRTAAAPERAQAMVRVDAHRLDELIDLVGELLTAESGIGQLAARLRVPELDERAATLSALVQDVRDRALQLRMVKIGATFQRFQRVVHDVSQELGKDVELRIDGADTELDKTVVEKIGDPLMHLVRNALDHGIEQTQQRLASGKPAQGQLALNACHDAGHIVIEVSDDGRGLDRERIVAKAVERGLVAAGAVLSDDEAYRLIFEPGFSTAAEVTSLSGRGVGMDVVKRNIEALRGSVRLRSRPGHGTSVEVRLPLTLAIIDGFMVGVGKTVYALPLDTVEECVAFSSEPGRDYTNLRGQALPFVRLSALFGSAGGGGRREHIVVVRHGGQRIGVVVDALLGECHTVIKPLGRLFAGTRCISGSTILGSGEVALIIDIAALAQHCIDAPART